MDERYWGEMKALKLCLLLAAWGFGGEVCKARRDGRCMIRVVVMKRRDATILLFWKIRIR